MRQEAETRECLEKAIAEFKIINKATNRFLEKNPINNNSREYLDLINLQVQILEKICTLTWVLNISRCEINYSDSVES